MRIAEDNRGSHPPTIFVVDDDPTARRAIQGVGSMLGLPVQSFPSAAEFLSNYDSSRAGCLVLDVKMPEMNGLELQQRLIDDAAPIPVIMVSGQADTRCVVDAMTRGAITFLDKPCQLTELAHHIRRGLEIDSRTRRSILRAAETESKFALLTHKEREVYEFVADGLTNRQIAGRLHLSIRAVEDRRARLMKKLGARSVVELVLLRRTPTPQTNSSPNGIGAGPAS